MFSGNYFTNRDYNFHSDISVLNLDDYDALPFLLFGIYDFPFICPSITYPGILAVDGNVVLHWSPVTGYFCSVVSFLYCVTLQGVNFISKYFNSIYFCIRFYFVCLFIFKNKQKYANEFSSVASGMWHKTELVTDFDRNPLVMCCDNRLKGRGKGWTEFNYFCLKLLSVCGHKHSHY